MNFHFLRRFGVFLVIVMLALLTVALVSADDNVDPSQRDGRINLGDWVGGNAVYCIDHTGTPTSDGWSDGGIRVLNGDGQVIFFASAAEINAANATTDNVLIKSEGGLSLYRQPDGGFSLNGFDEWGKPYTFVFNSCVPIGPIPYTHAEIITDPCKLRGAGVFGPQNFDPCLK